MSHLERLKTPAIAALAVVGVIALKNQFDLSIPGFSAPEVGGAQIESSSKLTGLRLAQDVLLVKGVGDTSSSLETELKYTGIRKLLNNAPGRGMHTTVEQDGEVQLGIRSGGLIEDEDSAKKDRDSDEPIEMTVDSRKLFTQVVDLGPTETHSDDGFLVQARSLVHEDEARREERGDGLDHYGQNSFENKCGDELLPVFEPGVKEWVKTQEDIPPNKTINISYIDKDGNRIALGQLKLPKKKLPTPKKLLEDIYGDKADNVKLKKFIDEDCVLTTEVLGQIKQINGGKPEPVGL